MLAMPALPATVAVAQDDDGPIGEIIVTAERREAALQSVPLAVSALDVEQLENLQIRDAQDLQRIVPSLHMFNNITSPTNLSLSLRGGLQQDASLVVAESPIGIYVDDVFVGRLNGNNSTLSDIERVEVLRGPQGTLYGRNTGYGAIKFISRSPGEDAWFDVAVGGGNDDQVLARTSLGGGLTENWAGSFAAQYKEKGDQFFNVAESVSVGDEENASFRGKLRFIGSETSDFVLSVAYSNSDNDSLQMINGITPNVPADAQFTTDDLVFPNGEWNTNTAWGQLQPPPLRDKPQAETEQTIVGATFTTDLSEGMTLKYIAGYVKTDDFFHTDFSGNAAGQAAFVGASNADSKQFTQELQLLGAAMEDRLNYILGVFYLNEEADQQFGWNFVTGLSQSFIQTEVDSLAFFGEAGYDITDNLKVTAGARWTEDRKDFSFDFERLAGNLFGLPPTTEQVVLADEWDEWTPKVGVDYTMGDMLLYAQAARGYKGGGFSAIALASTFPVGVYDPETNWTYEGGLKADWLGQRLRTNLAYFFSDIKDIQQNATVPGGPGFEFPVENSGDAEIQGLEFEITAVPFDGLNLFLAGALMDGEYKNLNPNSAAGAADDLFGVEAKTPQTPDYTVSIGFDYTFDLPGELFGDLSFGADYYEIDEYITSATNDQLNSGWDIWNAFVSADFAENWELKLTGKNLADDFIVTSGSRALGGFIVLPPREILLTLTYRYGE
jgi:iron complex outermembrane receptor protein